MSAPVVAPRRRDTCLGIHLGHREVGLAVVTRERLIDAHVLTIRKIPSMDGRERRLRQVIVTLIAETGVTTIAIVEPPRRRGDNGSLVAVVHDEAKRRALPVEEVAAECLRTTYTATGARPSNRAVGLCLVGRFPELRRCVDPAAPVVPGARVRTRSDRERYFGRMFLALAAALVALDDGLKAKLPL